MRSRLRLYSPSLRTSLRDRARRLLAKRTTPLAEFLGYGVTEPDRRDPLADDWTGITTGEQLVLRRTTHGDAVDWTRQPNPGLENQPFRPPAPRVPRRRA